MKTSKIYQAVVVVLAFSVLVGCRDQITSSGESESSIKENEKDVISPADENLVFNQAFNTQIKLKPFRSYTFNVSNAGFDQFNSIYIENLSMDRHNDKFPSQCQNLFVYGNTFHECIILGCDNKGFEAKEITIENLSSRMIDLKVSLGGIKKKAAIPVDTE